MDSSWQPAPEFLQQLAACLKDTLNGFDRNAQQQAELVGLTQAIVTLSPKSMS